MGVDATLRCHKGNSKLQVSDSDLILLYMCYKHQEEKQQGDTTDERCSPQEDAAY